MLLHVVSFPMVEISCQKYRKIIPLLLSVLVLQECMLRAAYGKSENHLSCSRPQTNTVAASDRSSIQNSLTFQLNWAQKTSMGIKTKQAQRTRFCTETSCNTIQICCAKYLQEDQRKTNCTKLEMKLSGIVRTNTKR